MLIFWEKVIPAITLLLIPPLEDIMFGGCLIKEEGAGKGNLAEANVEEWPNTVRKVKMKYPEVKKIIVGHGKSGGIELLDYTIKLFE